MTAGSCSAFSSATGAVSLLEAILSSPVRWTLYAVAAVVAVTTIASVVRAVLERRTRLLERLVDERTSALAEANRRLEDANDALRRLILTDPLTGLKNRRFVNFQMKEEASLVQRQYERKLDLPDIRDNLDLVFLMVDFDRFKEINDLYGHSAGDEVLLQMRDILCLAVRDADMVVRWGGEEFLVAARNTSRADAQHLAERIRSLVSAYPFDVGSGETIHRTCSIGFAAYPFLPDRPSLVEWQEVAEMADLSLLAAKRSGRDTWVGLEAGRVLDAATLMERIKRDVASVIGAGELHVIAPEADASRIVWPPVTVRVAGLDSDQLLLAQRNFANTHR